MILYSADCLLLPALLFIDIILFYFVGLKVANYKSKKNAANQSSGLGPFEGAMLGLISLLLAFTFNKSASYYDTRRELLVHESNCIGTVLLRSDLYPDSIREAFRSDVKDYIAVRIQYYEAGDDEIQTALQKASVISERIWNRAAMVSQKDGSVVKSMQMIPAVNDMIDAVSSREEARRAHVPEPILWLLFLLCLAGSFIVGYASKSKKADWIILLSYSVMMVMTVYLILDLDQPRKGIINTNSTHENMYNLLNSFKQNEVKTQ